MGDLRGIPSSDPQNLITSWMRRIGSWLDSMPLPRFIALVSLIGILRMGPLPIGPDWVTWLKGAALTFPEPSSYLSSSWLIVLVMKGTGSPHTIVWWLGGIAAWFLVLSWLIHLTRNLGSWRRPTILVIVLSPPFATTLSMLGHYDIVFIAGSLLVVLSKSRMLAGLGILLCLGANPEQSLAAALALVMLSYAVNNRHALLRSLAFLTLSIVSFLTIRAWQSNSVNSGSRLTQLTDLQGSTLAHIQTFTGRWPVATYAFFGGLWIVVLVAISLTGGYKRILAGALGVVFIPAMATATTGDGTRVFAAVSAGALALLISSTWRTHWSNADASAQLLGATFLLLILTPAILIDTGGPLRLPYQDILDAVLRARFLG